MSAPPALKTSAKTSTPRWDHWFLSAIKSAGFIHEVPGFKVNVTGVLYLEDVEAPSEI